MYINETDVRKLISSTLNIAPEEMEKIRCEDDLRNTGLNSITSIEMIIKFEEEWNISIADEDLLIENVSTIGKIIELLEKYKCDKSA